uniref:Uncharacterized protein n=1 Tax=Anguilla anguilla TaxID=7936 RepID=A0A0E9VN17_ANGAN
MPAPPYLHVSGAVRQKDRSNTAAFQVPPDRNAARTNQVHFLLQIRHLFFPLDFICGPHGDEILLFLPP